MTFFSMSSNNNNNMIRLREKESQSYVKKARALVTFRKYWISYVILFGTSADRTDRLLNQ